MTEKEQNGYLGGSAASMLPKKEQIEAFKAGLRGELIQRGDERYDAARKVYNVTIQT